MPPSRVRGGAAVCPKARRGRDHRLEERQRQRDAHAAQERPPRQVRLVMNAIVFLQAWPPL